MRRVWTALALVAGVVGLTAGRATYAQTVEVEVETFGISNIYRPGDVVPMRVSLTLTGAPQRAMSAWVQWEVPNADGDIGEYGRPVSLNNDTPVTRWLYAPIAPDPPMGTVWSIRVFEYPDGRRTREIGGLRIAPPGTGRVDLGAAMVGVIGQRQLGLSQLRLANARGAPVFSAHEDTQLVFGINPGQDLPDRWEGLKAFEVLVWGEGSPDAVNEVQVEALRAWMRRGGHLVVVLPADGNPWGIGQPGSSFFDDLLPSTPPRTDRQVDLSELVPLLSKSRDVNVRFPVGVQVFADVSGDDDIDALDNGWEPLVALPDGRVVIVRRRFGHGWMTLVGIDLMGRLNSVPLSNGTIAALPQADAFWNRILGRRADTPTGTELKELDEADMLVTTTPRSVHVGSGPLIQNHISLSGQAGSGLFMAFGLFLLYWLVAGPGGFLVLKHYKRVQHAWLVFAGAAAMFTALAWVGVNLIRESAPKIRHLTVLDRISQPDGGFDNDPQYDRATSWISLYTPGYGTTQLDVEAAPDVPGVERQAHRDLLVPWTPPLEPSQPFPNIDRFLVNLDASADTYALPSRSTATRLRAEWLGGLDPEWGGTIREGETIVAQGNGLSGKLVHDLPAPLTNVTVIWVTADQLWSRRYGLREGREWVEVVGSGTMLQRGWLARTNSAWEAGAELDLAAVTERNSSVLSVALRSRYIDAYKGGLFDGLESGPRDAKDRRAFLEMLSLYRQLPPPQYSKASKVANPDDALIRRFLGRELDLGTWLTRPCVIVIGFLEASVCPVPLRVDGETVESEGVTVVRWIHPLPVTPQETIAPAREGA